MSGFEARVTLTLRVREILLPEVGIIIDYFHEVLDPRFKLRKLPATEVRGIVDSVAIFALDGIDSGT